MRTGSLHDYVLVNAFALGARALAHPCLFKRTVGTSIKSILRLHIRVSKTVRGVMPQAKTAGQRRVARRAVRGGPKKAQDVAQAGVVGAVVRALILVLP